MVSPPSESGAMRSSSLRPLRSTTTAGRRSRRLSMGTRLCPPARILTSSPPAWRSERASSRVSGRAYRNGAGFTGRPLAHEQGAGNLSAHLIDLLATDALRLEACHEHLQPVGRRRIAALAQVGPEDEVLRTYGPDAGGRVGEGNARR